MRRSFISNLLDMGIDLLTTRQLAGHINLASTVSYDVRGAAAMQEAANMVTVPYMARRPMEKPPRPKPMDHKAAQRTWELSTLFLGKYAWEVLDALQGDRWITISIPRQRTRVWYGKAARTLPRGLVQAPEHQARLRDPHLNQSYINRYDGLKRAMLSLGAHGLVQCDEATLSTGKRRDFAGYRLTALGRLVFRTACAAGMHRQRFQLSRLHDRLMEALSKRK